jgi:hypothetical protein
VGLAATEVRLELHDWVAAFATDPLHAPNQEALQAIGEKS